MKVGIVGCGEISSVHANAIVETGKCKITSVCDLHKERAEALAKRYGVSKVYTDFSKMLSNEDLDIIHVVTSPQVHMKLANEAMNSGCNVLVEKPMCMTVEEADSMIETAKRNKVKLGVIHSFLFTPAISKALNMVKEGEIGDLLWVDTVISINSLLKWQNARGFPEWYYHLQGGLFGEIIPHGLYVQLGFIGHLNKIFGLTRKAPEESKLVPYSEVQVLMDGEKCPGSLLMSTRIVSPYTILMVRLVTSKRILLINVPTATIVEVKVGSSSSVLGRAKMNIGPAFQMISSSLSLAAKRLSGSVRPHMTHGIIAKKFVESIENDSRPPVTPEEGREVVKATNLLWKNLL